MCVNNQPLVCLECGFKICIDHLSPGNLANYIKLLVQLESTLDLLKTIIISQKELFIQSKEYNTVLSGICYHSNEEEIINFLPCIKECNYRYDKWYLHYAISTKKNKVINYLLQHGCPLRIQHLQSCILSENEELIKKLIKKCEYNVGEKIQKSLADWLSNTINITIIDLIYPMVYPPTQKQCLQCASQRNYYLLYLFLMHLGLRLTSVTSQKILEILYTNLLSSHSSTTQQKIKYGLHYDIECIQQEERSQWYRKCVEWCELSGPQRYFKYMEERNMTVLKSIENYICKDVIINIVFSYL
jgi:hypothetical protein